MASDGAERLDATVSGRVQGVGFRWFVRDEAERMGLTGWVANEPGGTVRVVAEGDPEAIAQLVERLRQGPPGAHVGDLRFDRRPATGEFDAFGIRSGWHGGD
ncbi:MAG TPA: acylphosphatase [Candidatus Limnocylindrales bacterium]|nr:acylphosphatase [Candidatus Limnocylindrales bacterium]